MKMHLTKNLVRALGCGLLLMIAGCVTQRIVWSPDGRIAAVLGAEGLYLGDPEGSLTGLLVPNVTRVSWFPDSRRLAMGRVEQGTNWTQLTASLSPPAIAALRQDAAGLLPRIQAGKDRSDLLEDLKERYGDDMAKNRLNALLMCLGAEHPEVNLTSALEGQPVKNLKAELNTLSIARVEDRRVDVGPVIATELGTIQDIRVSPTGVALAYTVDSGDAGHLSVVAAEGGQAQELASPAALYPDWSPDGDSLWYISAAHTNRAGDDVVLGVLARRKVMASGQVKPATEREEFAGLMFNGQSRVRCLRDGRILFASEEWRLPVTTNDLPQRQQLFALDPERQATLTPLVPRGVQEMLPDNLSWFDVSPDQKRIAFSGEKSLVAVFTLASGNVTVVQPRTQTDSKSLPSWRSGSELCYVAVLGAGTNQHCEVALWPDGKTNVISKSWPEVVRKGLLD